MSRKARRGGAWAGTAGAQELLPPPASGAELVVAGVDTAAATLTIAAAPAPRLTAVGMGLLKDGRHVAFEAEVEGGKVLAWKPLCAKPTVDAPERAWWQVAYARVYVRRALSETEEAANHRDAAGVRPGDFDHGQAVAIHTRGKITVALAMALQGMAVAEPEVLVKAPRPDCWVRIDTWAGLNMLPKRRQIAAFLGKRT